jgi:hypothetical protein
MSHDQQPAESLIHRGDVAGGDQGVYVNSGTQVFGNVAGGDIYYGNDPRHSTATPKQEVDVDESSDEALYRGVGGVVLTNDTYVGNRVTSGGPEIDAQRFPSTNATTVPPLMRIHRPYTGTVRPASSGQQTSRTIRPKSSSVGLEELRSILGEPDLSGMILDTSGHWVPKNQDQ